jgi:small subunit ribosomal protein S3
MIEKKIIASKKTQFAVKEFIKQRLKNGEISRINIERTPIGERVVIFTGRPGVVIGKSGETIQELTSAIKSRFGLENLRIEIAEIENIEFDAQTIADQIATSLERFGHSSFKIIAYRALERIKAAGGLGTEIILSGKLPSERARRWRFAYGYMKKTGEIDDIVNSAKAVAQTKPGVVGIKVSIVPKDAKISDHITVEAGKIIEEVKETGEGEIKEKAEEKKEEKVKRKRKKKEIKEKENGDNKK